MTGIKRASSKTNPRGAGRKPKPDDERKVKTSVSLHPQTLAKLSARGGGILSKGIEMTLADTLVLDDDNILIGNIHAGPGAKPFQAWARQRSASGRSNTHTLLKLCATIDEARNVIRKAMRPKR